MSSEDEMDDFEVSDYDMLGAMGKLKELWVETNRILFYNSKLFETFKN